ncbi:biotin transporter BioY [Guggenheimella bovis]
MNTKTLTRMALMVALLTVFSWISVPIGPVPVTLQLIAVFLVSYLFSPKESFLIVLCWLLLGAVGVPVFSGFKSTSALIGPTAGFIVSFLLVAPFVSSFRERSVVQAFLISLVGLVIVYLLGSGWFMFVLKKGAMETLKLAVLPFVVIDVAKIAIALFVSKALRKVSPSTL